MDHFRKILKRDTPYTNYIAAKLIFKDLKKELKQYAGSDWNELSKMIPNICARLKRDGQKFLPSDVLYEEAEECRN